MSDPLERLLVEKLEMSEHLGRVSSSEIESIARDEHFAGLEGELPAGEEEGGGPWRVSEEEAVFDYDMGWAYESGV